MTAHRTERPPRLPRLLLRALLPDRPRAWALLGDLEELWRERRSRGGRLRADAWYVWQAAGAAWRYRRTGTTTTRTGGEAMRDLVAGTRASVRRLASTPAYAAAVAGTLALGVGANAAVFSIISGVLLDPLPYPAPSRIAFVYEYTTGADIPPGWASARNYVDWRARATSFESMALFRGRSVSVTTDVIPEYAYGALVTPGFFDVFATEPALGRRFTGADAAPGAPAVVILGHGLWTRGFGGDAGLVGRTIRIDGAPHTVVGVMPPGFEAHGDWVGLPVQLWRPFEITEDVLRQGRSFHVAGRLARGIDVRAAQSEMSALSASLGRLRPEENADWQVRVEPYRRMIVGDAAPGLWLMLAATALLLVIACVNVANLALNRVLDRARELATRRALGAGRRTVVGVVLGESVILALVGGGLGLGLAGGLLRLVRASDPGRIPRLDQAGLDGRVVAVAVAVTMLAAFASAAAAALAASRTAPAAVLRGQRGVGALAGRGRSALVATQLALTFGLLLAAGLLARSFDGLRRADLGFDATDVTTATVALSWTRVSTLEERTRFTTSVLDVLRAIPGVASAGMINSLPLSGSNQTQRVDIEGVTEPDEGPAFAIRGVSPGYVETLHIPVLSGRALDERDVRDPRSVLVNSAAATRFWPGGTPLGRHVRVSGDDDWLTVVGVVGDVHHDGPERPARPELYLPYSVEYLTSKSFVVRWAGSGRAAPERVRDAIFAVDPEQPVREVRSMEAWTRRATAAPRFQSLTMALAALFATALAAVGLFGLLAGLVRARTRDLAVRAALGASRGRVLALLARRTGSLVAAGVVGGTALALLLGGTLRRFLFGVSERDPAVMLAAAGLFVLVACAAAWLPARRATSVDPARVLREE